MCCPNRLRRTCLPAQLPARLPACCSSLGSAGLVGTVPQPAGWVLPAATARLDLYNNSISGALPRQLNQASLEEVVLSLTGISGQASSIEGRLLALFSALRAV